MNVLSRIIGALVTSLLTWIGLRLGLTFSPEDHAALTALVVGLVVSIYGIVHPLVRSWLVRRFPHLGDDRRITDAPEVKP